MTSKYKFNKNISQLKCPTNLPLSGILPPVKRIVVIGDVHGDLDEFKRNLRISNLIDTHDNWIGGDTVLVQLGDLIDSCRGEECVVASSKDKGHDLDLLYYVVKLNEKAMKHDGAVYSLMGNHEIMNVQGNFNYVSPKNFDDFVDLFINKDKISPYEARKEAFKPGNPIANFLACSKLGVLIIGSNVFMHAGIVPEISKEYSPKKINKILKLWLQNKLKNSEEMEKILFSSQYSPFWTRVLGKLDKDLPPDSQECIEKVNPVLEHWKVSHIHVGHTPSFNKIVTTCGDKVIRHDIASSHAFDKWRKEPNKIKP